MSDNPKRILVVDDEESMRFFVRRGLARCGYDVVAVESGERGLEAWREASGFDAVVLDLRMPGMDGHQLLSGIRELDPDARAVVMTAYGTVENAVEAMRRGARDFVTKPFEIEELQLALERVLEGADEAAVAAEGALAQLRGQSRPMQELRETILRLAESDTTVFVLGESGTGKELVARALHEASARRGGPFTALHCASLPDTLLESELFGHEAGAFTGAVSARAGKLARANGGTVFLDEVTEMGLTAQNRLERFLATREIVPLGGYEPLVVDARVVAAANKDPEEAVAAGTFRKELFYRLNVVPLRVPPLRQRHEDVPELVAHFVTRAAARLGAKTHSASPAICAALGAQPWPGNVRELQNAIERMVVLHRDVDVLDVAHLPDDFAGRALGAESADGKPRAYSNALHDFERRYLEDLFRRTGGNVSEAARLAGLSRGHMHRKVKQLGLDPAEFR